MTTTKQSWLKRSLAMLLAVMMVMSMGVTNAFAADSGSEESNVPVISLGKSSDQHESKRRKGWGKRSMGSKELY